MTDDNFVGKMVKSKDEENKQMVLGGLLALKPPFLKTLDVIIGHISSLLGIKSYFVR